MKLLLLAASLITLTACSETYPSAPDMAPADRLVSQASGSGQFRSDILVQPDPAGEWRTFSFEAKRTSSSTTGTFELMNRAQDVRMGGKVDCLKVVGNQAWFRAVITRSSDSTRIGNIVIWRVIDNGARQDLISPVYTADFDCEWQWGSDIWPTEAGNILVR